MNFNYNQSKALTQTDIESRRTKKQEIREKQKKFNQTGKNDVAGKLFDQKGIFFSTKKKFMQDME